MTINTTGFILLALMYFVAGQAIAHPIYLAASEESKNKPSFKNRLGITFGLLWPIAYPMYVLTFRNIQRKRKEREEKGRLTPEHDAYERIERERRTEHQNERERAREEQERP